MASLPTPPAAAAAAPTLLQDCLGTHIDSAACTFSAEELVIFQKIIASGCTIKSQQRGEPDFTEKQLCNFLYTSLKQKPGAFLARFGKHLDERDLHYFDNLLEKDFEVNFRVKELQKTLSQSSKERLKRVRNRRYECLKQLMAKSTYFTEEEMRQRNPLLFEYYIGQFLTEDEKIKPEENPSDMVLSSMILKNIDIDRRTSLLREQMKSEQCQLEESDSSLSSSEEEEEDKEAELPLAAMVLSSDPDLAAREKSMLRDEFLATMQASFLDGKDKDFDYSKVDFDETYDSLEIRNRDAEDEYFDAEEPSWCEESSCHCEDESGRSNVVGEDLDRDTTTMDGHDDDIRNENEGYLPMSS